MRRYFNRFPCQKCGGEAIWRQEGNTQGWFCAKCDWSMVTTCMPEILSDTTHYEVRAVYGDFRNIEHIKTVAQLMGVNFLVSRRLLKTGKVFVVFNGLAHHVIKVRDILKGVGMDLEIKPSFRW